MAERLQPACHYGPSPSWNPTRSALLGAWALEPTPHRPERGGANDATSFCVSVCSPGELRGWLTVPVGIGIHLAFLPFDQGQSRNRTPWGGGRGVLFTDVPRLLPRQCLAHSGGLDPRLLLNKNKAHILGNLGDWQLSLLLLLSLPIPACRTWSLRDLPSRSGSQFRTRAELYLLAPHLQECGLSLLVF